MSEAIAPGGKPAIVQTAMAEINVVRIGGKQMTKAVFNQLVECPIESIVGKIDDIEQSTDNVWGWVNDHPGTYCPSPPDHFRDLVGNYPKGGVPHRHVIGVNQSGDLVRSTIWFEWYDKDEGIAIHDRIDGWLATHLPQLFIAV